MTDLVAAATALIPELRERAAAAEQLRRVPPENIAALRRARLFKVLQPRAFGGHQASLHDHIDVVAALAKGCASTAWVAGVVHAHSWLMGLLPEQALRDTYGADPDTIITAVIGPRGTARRVEGGYRLDGFWPFCSGVEHAQFVLLGAAVADGSGGDGDEGDFLIPAADIVIKDDWHVVGLRGTGSCSVAVKDLFVPAHRFVSLRAAVAGELRGQEGWLYRAAAVPVLALALAPTAVGVAEATLADFAARLPGREVSYTREKQIDMPVTHVQVAAAATKIATARLLLHRCADAIEAPAKAGETMAFAERARVRMDGAYAVRLCLEAVEALMLASGGSGLAESNPVQRAWRDLHAINMHGLLNLETNQEMYGRVVLGLTPNTPLI
jgi:3-hydroxy-9,10-secoandrosta-1,3,5(10)-triene-9,17-dione monooxygenase